jgi:hypothetical protein
MFYEVKAIARAEFLTKNSEMGIVSPILEVLFAATGQGDAIQDPQVGRGYVPCRHEGSAVRREASEQAAIYVAPKNEIPPEVGNLP